MEELRIFSVLLSLLALCSVARAVVPTGPPLTVVNLALNKPSIQSTTYEYSGQANYPLPQHNTDGNTDDNYQDQSCIGTAGGETTPWWAVDLGASHTIQYVVITTELGQPTYGWLSNFTVALTNISPWTTPPSLAPCASTICVHYPGTPATVGPATYFCTPYAATGRYLPHDVHSCRDQAGHL
jgi:hypothetical protein